MIKINQIRGLFKPSKWVFETEKNIKKLGVQTDFLRNTLYINKKSFNIGKNNIIQFDDLNEKINISFTSVDGKDIFAIIDYEERIDE